MITLVSTEKDFHRFLSWENKCSEYQLDVETDLLEWPDKNLMTIQFGDTREQWVFHLPFTPSKWLARVREILSGTKLKLIHNAAFEYQVFAKYGIYLENVYDTMLMEQILYAGIEQDKGYYSLKGLVKRYFDVELSKELQLSFTREKLSWEQVEYAAYDVMYLQRIRAEQIWRIKNDGLENVAALENEVVLAFTDICHNGMTLDKEKWRANIALAKPIIDESEKNINAYITQGGSLHAEAVRLGFIQIGDHLRINWKSPVQKRRIFSLVYPALEGATKAVVTKYLREHDDLILKAYIEGDTLPFEDHLLGHHYDWLIAEGFLVQDGTPLLNWDSPVPRMKLFRTIWPEMPSGNSDQVLLLAEKHAIGVDYEEYIKSKKLVTSFGEAFIEKYVRSDGKVHPQVHQVKSTGRISIAKPGMQQIPANDRVGTRYRNAFVCQDGWTFVDSDYASQELVLIAHLSQDPVWQQALLNGEDLHSVCANLVYGERWRAVAEPNCAFALTRQKCGCKKHKSMRSAAKSINFGLAYGMGPNKLSGSLKISVEEAEEMIRTFFTEFPAIGKTLETFGRFGVDNGYAITPAPFHRRRYFELHEYYQWDLPFFNRGRYVDYLCSIERESKNLPIQGGAADITKVALVLIRNYINENGYRDDIKIVMQVHDQVTTICKTELTDWWTLKLTELMEDAAKVVIPSGLLKAETASSNQCWTK